ncbi:MAG: hypothetical protein HYX61_13625 [Gammaproteobacteria bacterium]|jgi:hypothetical protein|nr:hypothetical protein [Gammaproteobacteria bacterium]
MIGISIPPRKLASSTEESFSLSPEDKQFIPHFLMKKETISLKVPFHNELKAESIHQNHYLDSAQRAAYKVTIKDGLFYNADGRLLEGPLVYVLFPDYRLYAASVYAKLNHSHISSGLDLKGAGIMYFERGRLITVSNDSGHYKPTRSEMQDALKWFSDQNLHKPFIFEDHSDQHCDQELNGIKYSHVHIDPAVDHVALTPIGTQDLIASLSALKQEAISSIAEDSDSEFENFIQQLSEKCNFSDDDSVYFSPARENQPQSSSQASSSTMDDKNIFNRRELMMYTCLQFAKDGKNYSSRFNGVLKISL